jgi:two-component system sensor histidine kinase UhpB
MKEMWKRIVKGEIWRGEFRNKAKDGMIYWVDATIIPFLDREGKPYQYLSIRNDITQRKLAEESMLQLKEEMHEQRLQEQKKLTRVMINAQERERNHIGRELHDNVNQILAGTKIYLGMAATKNPQAKELIDYSLSLINDAIEEIRQLSSRQVTPIKNVNLHDLIDHLLHHLSDNALIRTEFIYEMGDSNIDDDLKLNIYRIIQEQVGNIVKHAEAKNVKVSIEARDHQLTMQVTDDGKGFDPTKKRKGIGISNMINRVESFNGEIKIVSSPGYGCAIQMMIPF